MITHLIKLGSDKQKAVSVLESIKLPSGVTWFMCAGGSPVMESGGAFPDATPTGYCAILATSSISADDFDAIAKAVDNQAQVRLPV